MVITDQLQLTQATEGLLLNMLNTMSLEIIPSMSKPAMKEKVVCRPSQLYRVVGRFRDQPQPSSGRLPGTERSRGTGA